LVIPYGVPTARVDSDGMRVTHR